MTVLEVALRTVLAVVFGVAFASKIRTRAAFAEFARSLGDVGWLRGRSRRAAAGAIPAAEAGTALLLVPPATAAWGFGAAAARLAAFTAVTASGVARGQRIRCRCFGAGASQIGPAQIARNVVLLALALAGLGLEPVSHGGVSAAGLVLAIGLALPAGLVLVRWDDLAALGQVR
jgi:hypothetical protein